ncbi:MAG: hypothetical protein ACEY3J_02060 [Arsenophonus sp.]
MNIASKLLVSYDLHDAMNGYFWSYMDSIYLCNALFEGNKWLSLSSVIPHITTGSSVLKRRISWSEEKLALAEEWKENAITLFGEK